MAYVTDAGIQIITGDDKYIQINFTDNDSNPIDITGWTIHFKIKKTQSDLDAEELLDKEFIAPSDAESTAGRILIHLEDTDTLIEAGNWYYFIQYEKDSSGDKHHFSISPIEVIQGQDKTS